MNKKILVFIFIIIASNFILMNYLLESENVGFTSTYTKAICEGQICRDFLIECSSNKKVVSMKSISGFVTFDDNWIDIRENKTLC